MDMSCAFPTALSSPDDIALAERLGYHRAWVYDTPQQSPDVWMTLALAADRTERIGLGPGVLVPSLRHPMVNASATATLAALAPGRVAVAFGTGFSGRRAMGYGAVKWAFMEAYLRAFRGLLRGEVVEWEGAQMQMLHPEGHAPARPVDVPVLVGALGPKGNKVARELGDGLFATLAPPEFMTEHSWVPYLEWGTVLDDDEKDSSEHARVAAGPGWALSFHGATSSAAPMPSAHCRRRRVAERRRSGAGRTPPPRRPLRTLRGTQRRRRRGVARGRQQHAARGDPQRNPRRDPPQDRRLRRARRHRNRLPALRTGSPARTRAVPRSRHLLTREFQ
jgi:alkanesulfonate monooxygenase SsuD/methylene tetrahydromethanopterin reductase-like flavin-dependent oxidoreductase (luciferase family)